MFLAVAEGGTVRAAAHALSLNHATIIRGIDRLEGALNTKLFERLASGYRLTDAGTDILQLAGQMAAASSRIEARIFGRDQEVSGSLRLTLPVSIATGLLMPTLAVFRSTYPDIALDVISSTSVVNLGNREADVALRVVPEGMTPPGNLYGARLCELHMGYYIHRSFVSFPSERTPAWLLGYSEVVPEDWQPVGGIRMAETPVRFAELQSRLEAARVEMGIAHLPCFLGDAEPMLVRVPGSEAVLFGHVWLLTHGDTRRTTRVRLLCDQIRHAMDEFSARLAGRLDPP